MAHTPLKEGVRCSFCGKSQHEVVRVVAGPGVFICNDCVALCNQIIGDVAQQKARGPGTQGQSGGDDLPTLKCWEALSDDDLLAEMVKAHGAHDNVDRAVAQFVAALRVREVSWARIGEAIGMTRQSAWERFSGEE